MPQFEHYMYVLECSDGSLYAGYATDVDRRVATHQAGKGAKYTKARLPVRLLAKARFYSKERAMSAEARFKRLSRGEKDRVLGMAAESSLEEALASELPGFGEEPALELVDRLIFENDPISDRIIAVHSVTTPSLSAPCRPLINRANPFLIRFHIRIPYPLPNYMRIIRPDFHKSMTFK